MTFFHSSLNYQIHVFLIFIPANSLDIGLKPQGTHEAMACLYIEGDQEVGDEAGTAHAMPHPALSRPSFLIAYFVGLLTEGHCICFYLMKPKALIVLFMNSVYMTTDMMRKKDLKSAINIFRITGVGGQSRKSVCVFVSVCAF
jgi:hypothetical protein